MKAEPQPSSLHSTLVRQMEYLPRMAGGEGSEELNGCRRFNLPNQPVAKVWNPTEIHNPEVLRKVLEQMQTSEGELRHLDAALNRVEPGTLVPILCTLRLSSLGQDDSFDSLKKVVLEVERAAEVTS
jgi:hypothetical protein